MITKNLKLINGCIYKAFNQTMRLHKQGEWLCVVSLSNNKKMTIRKKNLIAAKKNEIMEFLTLSKQNNLQEELASLQ